MISNMPEKKLKNFDELKAEMESKGSLTKDEINMYMHLAHQAGMRLGSKVVSESFNELVDALLKPSERETA
jgi:hypothetical protein